MQKGECDKWFIKQVTYKIKCVLMRGYIKHWEVHHEPKYYETMHGK